MAEKIQWKNRIIDRKMMRVGDLKPFVLNPKHHPHVQTERLKALLDKFGIVGEILAFRDDKGDLVCFDGHARQGLDPNQEWPVCILDLTFSEASELVLMFDPISALATPDPSRQMDLMQDLRGVDGVLGAFLDELADESGFGRGNGKTNKIISPQRMLGDRQKQIKPVLYADEIADFEQALALTGLKNRGQAILEVCRFYIGQKRQFYNLAENIIADSGASDDRKPGDNGTPRGERADI